MTEKQLKEVLQANDVDVERLTATDILAFELSLLSPQWGVKEYRFTIERNAKELRALKAEELRRHVNTTAGSSI